jgi:hypothetical protein
MSIRLRQAQELFLNWHRLGKRKGRASKQLVQEAVSLLPDYPLHQISEALQIPISTLKNWKRATEKKKEKFDFVPLPVFSNKADLTQNGDFYLTLPHGMQLSLQGQSVEKAVQLIRALIEGLRTCSI